ncbi:MAG: DUF1836 domain-containing protein [Clostridia bacterium]|nr:DUF1836 domain-containing protein [Clostridia bacterium]
MIDKLTVNNYHLPRWEELPDIDLYMDQVLTILNKYVAIFSEDNSKPITSTMINNYIKQKVVKPPRNKKYDRVHLSYLLPVCILKQIMSISEICSGIEVVLKNHKIPESYDIFCQMLETGLKNAFENKPPFDFSNEETTELSIIQSAVASFVNLQYAKYLISEVKK